MGTIKIHTRTFGGLDSWVFPMKDSELDSRMKAAGFSPLNAIPIIKVEWPEGLHILNGLSVDPDELNFLAKSMDRFVKSEHDQFIAAASELRNPDLQKLINLSFNLDHYTLVKDVTNLVQIGRDHTFHIHGGAFPKGWETLDFLQIGKDLLASGRGVPTGYGLLFENEEVPFEEVYDGTTFPHYYWRDHVISVILGYKGKSELLLLPEDEIAIDKALKRLGAPCLADCTMKIESYDNLEEIWRDRMENILEYEGLHEANQLAGVLAQPGFDRDKLQRMIEYTEVVGGEEIRILAEHLNDFTVIPGAKTAADVGKYIVQHELGYEVGEHMTKYVDYTQLGEDIMNERDGQFMDGAFVCMEDGCSLEQIMGESAQNMELGGCE